MKRKKKKVDLIKRLPHTHITAEREREREGGKGKGKRERKKNTQKKNSFHNKKTDSYVELKNHH